MLAAGEDPRFITRRLVILASEDIGLADHTSLLVATAAHESVSFIGLPEAMYPLAHAVIHMSLAPKSNAVKRAIGSALDDVVGSHRPGAARTARCVDQRARMEGAGKGYRYPHDAPAGVSGSNMRRTSCATGSTEPTTTAPRSAPRRQPSGCDSWSAARLGSAPDG